MRSSNFYERLGETLEKQKGRRPAKIDLGKAILRLRERQGLGATELCRRSGALDPKTLNAIEKGRIRNPSLESLQAIAKGLDCLIKDIFAEGELEAEGNFSLGSQKGAFRVEFPDLKIVAVSFTPLGTKFFCGKLLFGPKASVSGNLISHSASVFAEVVMGRFEIAVESKTVSLKEGDNLFLNGGLKHSFRNSLNRDSVLRIVALPTVLPPRV